MKIFYIIIIFLIIAALPLMASAQDSSKTKDIRHGPRFVDKNGDGYNDNAPDHDGDGIPNGLDPDWQKLNKGKKEGNKERFIDLDGDGINDLIDHGPNKPMEKMRGRPSQQGTKGSSLDQKQKQGKGEGRKKKGGKR